MRRRVSTSGKVRAMNFLAHLLLAGDDEGLRLGAMLGDFVRGNPRSLNLPAEIHKGIRLHRFIDHRIDSLPEVAHLRTQFLPPFRRYAGIIIDLAFDHELALRWAEYSNCTLEQFDREVRDMLARHQEILPKELQAFMRYADKRGLFATYREENEILFSLNGLGRRLSRSNPLHRVGEIWHELKPVLSSGFAIAFPKVQQEVAAWLREPGISSTGN
jgi:acyl carrier protein phosphodiesterase